MVIQVQSAGYDGGNLANITINNKAVKTHSGTNRGLHIVILNPDDGSISTAMCFDTHHSSLELDAFIAAGVPEGKIVVAACRDECSA